MSVQPLEQLSDDPVIDHLLLLFPNTATRDRVARALATAQMPAQEAGIGLRVPMQEVEVGSTLEKLSGILTDRERLNTRIAMIPLGADERFRRKAVALARPLAGLLQEYSDSWLIGLLSRNALAVHLQPLVQYPPGRLHGYECLVRGVSETRQIIPPAQLFRAARNLGMEYPLDTAAAKAAIAAAADVGFSNILFFINLLPYAIDDPHVTAQSMLAAVEMGGLRSDQVVIELVNAESMRDHQRLASILDGFRIAGFAVSLDDVGAGAASLLPLADLHADYVKLDAELCGKAAELDALERKVFLEICEQARQHGAIAIAKGVETEQQLRFAIDAGVRVTQGFIHARPQPMPLDAGDEDRMLRQVRRTAILAD